jgi:hypothetical protein
MANLFLKQAKQYVATRPVYPPELFDFIASKTPRRDMAWDVGTGNGQAAASVSRSSSLSPSPLPTHAARTVCASLIGHFLPITGWPKGKPRKISRADADRAA